MAPTEPRKPGLGPAIRHLRQQRDLSQEALAVAAGVSAGTLGAMERGRTYPRWDTVEAIASALDASLVELAKLAEKLKK
jgi:transcriptional regulator with XRE-family HTH domain